MHVLRPRRGFRRSGSDEGMLARPSSDPGPALSCPAQPPPIPGFHPFRLRWERLHRVKENCRFRDRLPVAAKCKVARGRLESKVLLGGFP